MEYKAIIRKATKEFEFIEVELNATNRIELLEDIEKIYNELNTKYKNESINKNGNANINISNSVTCPLCKQFAEERVSRQGDTYYKCNQCNKIGFKDRNNSNSINWVNQKQQ